MCGVLFGLLYRWLCTGTRGQNRYVDEFAFGLQIKADGRASQRSPRYVSNAVGYSFYDCKSFPQTSDEKSLENLWGP